MQVLAQSDQNSSSKVIILKKTNTRVQHILIFVANFIVILSYLICSIDVANICDLAYDVDTVH